MDPSEKYALVSCIAVEGAVDSLQAVEEFAAAVRQHGTPFVLVEGDRMAVDNLLGSLQPGNIAAASVCVDPVLFMELLDMCGAQSLVATSPSYVIRWPTGCCLLRSGRQSADGIGDLLNKAILVDRERTLTTSGPR